MRTNRSVLQTSMPADWSKREGLASVSVGRPAGEFAPPIEVSSQLKAWDTERVATDKPEY
jgi:hypothetical protein